MIGGTRQNPTTGSYTGYNQHATAGSRTAQNEDLYRGSIVQMDLCNHGANTEGFEFAVPTAGFRGPLAVVAENITAYELRTGAGGLNYQAGTVANLRAGGNVGLVCVGRCRARVKANMVAGVTLLGAVAGQMYLGPMLPDGQLYANVANSAAVANTNAETAFDKTYSIPANSLRVGDVIKIRISGTVVTNSTDTVVVKLYVNSTVLVASGTIDAASGDGFEGHAEFTVQAIGASGSIVGGGLSAIGTNSAAASAADIPSGDQLGATTVDTTAAVTISVKVTFSAADAGSTATLTELIVEKSTNPSYAIGVNNGPFAIAAETTDNSGDTAAADQLAWVLIVQPGTPF